MVTFKHLLRSVTQKRTLAHVMALVTVGLALSSARASTDDNRLLVARLDREFQAAVKINDVHTMDRILGEDMLLVHGNGKIDTRNELLREAREKLVIYERQDEDPGTQTVRVWGDTAMVTARLWVKGTYIKVLSLITDFGSATSMFERRRVGTMSSDKSRCHCPSEIDLTSPNLTQSR